MAENKIILKIKADAQAAKGALLAAAEKKAADASSKILAAAKEQIALIEKQTEAGVAEVEQRHVLRAELESRKNSLNNKRTVLEAAFSQAESKLNSLTGAEWEALITKIALADGIKGTEKLAVPATDRARYTAEFVAKLNAARQAAGKVGSLTLAEDAAAIKGGVLFIGEASDFDGSFATILREVRGRIEKDVAAMLFPPEVK